MQPPIAAFRIDDELAQFLSAGNSLLVATRDAALHPHATRACGLRVTGPSRVDVLLPTATSSQAFQDLRENGAIAICVASPRTYRTVQLKGRTLGIHDASPEDLILSQDQLQAFTAELVTHGVSRQQARNIWLFELRRVEVHLTMAFVQTPGPGAGKPVQP